jgi:hypothetical protein
MRKRTSKRRSSDVNLLSVSVVEAVTGEKPGHGSLVRKNPAAVALGKPGGVKGGPARAAKLSAGKRRQIARRAAEIRWSKKRQYAK